MRKKHRKSIVPYVFLTVFSAVFVYAVFHLAVYCRNYGQEADLENELRQIRQDAEKSENGALTASGFPKGTGAAAETEPGGAYRALKALNDDYIAWLDIPDTTISYPVVQRDNSFYLKHDFKQEKNSHGCIFLDEACGPEAPVWLIHGHHMKDGTMFGALKAYEEKAYISAHRRICLEGEGQQKQFSVFAVALIDYTKEQEADIFHYEQLPGEKEGFVLYLQALKENAYWYDGEMGERLAEEFSGTDGPEVLLLSTCEYHTALERLVIFAGKER